MVMYYDISNGDLIDIEDTAARVQTLSQAADTAIPRLMTVQEAAAIQHRPTPLPADIALLPVASLLAKWS